MSLVVKIIGIIIIICGFIAIVGTIYSANSELWELDMSKSFTPDRLFAYIIQYIGQVIVILIGIGVYVIGVKLGHHDS